MDIRTTSGRTLMRGKRGQPRKIYAIKVLVQIMGGIFSPDSRGAVPVQWVTG